MKNRRRLMSPERATLWATRAVWVICLATLVGFLIWFSDDVDNRISQSEDKVRAEQIVTAKAISGLRRANQQLRAAGEKPVVVPEDIVDDPDVTGPLVGPLLEQAQVDAAVANYCSSGACGVAATPRQVALAVASFCNLDGQCTGPRGPAGPPGKSGQAGADGQDGANGADGNSVEGPAGPAGPTGPPPTDEQVLRGVETYCSANDCQGPAGPKGEQGEVGPAGLGISSIACDSVLPLTINVTYSDGSVQTVSCGG